MSEIALAKINSFAREAQQADVQPSEEPIFILTESQLQDIIIRAIQEATVGLVERIKVLEGRTVRQDEKLATLERTQDTQAENELNMLRLINDLRHKEPGKTEISRAEKIAKYLQERPDHQATYETLKGHLHINNDLLNKSIKLLMRDSPGRYGIARTPGGDKRKRTLIMLPR
jgi:hypothetical protein